MNHLETNSISCISTINDNLTLTIPSLLLLLLLLFCFRSLIIKQQIFFHCQAGIVFLLMVSYWSSSSLKWDERVRHLKLFTGKMKRSLKYYNGMACNGMVWMNITCVFRDVDCGVKTLLLIICVKVIKVFKTFDCVTFTIRVCVCVCHFHGQHDVSFVRLCVCLQKESFDEK